MGEGESGGPSFSEDPDVIKLCTSSFEAVGERSIPHGQFTV
ncbi:hypothetical protein [Streptacidiphilus sp. EB103A]